MLTLFSDKIIISVKGNKLLQRSTAAGTFYFKKEAKAVISKWSSKVYFRSKSYFKVEQFFGTCFVSKQKKPLAASKLVGN